MNLDIKEFTTSAKINESTNDIPDPKNKTNVEFKTACLKFGSDKMLL
nr:hypothetical protein [Mycoplasmopsis bovis]